MTGDNSGQAIQAASSAGGKAQIRSEGGVRFRLWAPAHEWISLSLEPEGQRKASAMSLARMRMSRSLPFRRHVSRGRVPCGHHG